jgi:hypothetical protein
MLSFVEQLKDVIYGVEQTGGDPLERLIPAPPLIERLKVHALEILEKIPTAQNYSISGFLLEEFNEGFFDEGVRISNIFLNKLGITDIKQIEEILKGASEKRILRYFRSMTTRYPEAGDYGNLEDALMTSVAEIWEEGGTEVSRTYAYAKQRALITWNYREGHWSVTNLGRFFLELNAFHAICFLLTIDMCLSTGRHDHCHLSRDQLQNILEPESERHYHLIPIHRLNLQWMGILSERYLSGQTPQTPLGKKALEYVLSENNLMIDTVILSLQAEEQGWTYSGLKLEIQKLESILNSSLIDNTNQKSIQNALSLCKNGQYIDGLKILFPCIEGIINRMLQEIGKQPDKYLGWKNKVEYLVSEGVIPLDVATAIEIITGRNKTLHGQFEPPDPEYAYPLFQMAIVYLHRMLSAWSRFKKGAN